MAKITVKGPAITETKNGKKGEYTKTTQEATITTSSFMMTFEMDVDGPSKGYAPGDYTCDLEGQLKPGRYGPELPRFLKLTPIIADAVAKRA